MFRRILFATGICIALAAPAEAIPVFAHRYGLTCRTCHTVVPRLTPFGERFLASGYRIPGGRAKGVFPVAGRIEFGYASSGESGTLPKTIVDEVELLTGGAIGDRVSYWAEAYVVDGGMPGRTRDVWAAYRATPADARIPVTLRLGQFTLPLPIDPEAFRETTDHYAIWDQTAGINPFSFFAPMQGGAITVGDAGRGLALSGLVLRAHDQSSLLPTNGVDTMLTLQRSFGALTFSAYRYDGTRALDRFWRQGYGAVWRNGRTELDAVYQTGNDSAADVYGDALQSSGGFVQLRQSLGARTFAIVRWDATQDASFGRSWIYGAGFRPASNARLTLFQTVRRDDAGRLQHVVSSSLLVAF